ncbi:hypothetical protein D9611_006730 [Ephemerocybe angulata]|uniref:DUF6533 domain-containing protein n=1 Tax=Ephemerocybe angulata TaxID=980116 RepID=A0A8H5C759_9AGAR|nr:hypothetical protein D9611_006730 [Tulosesus angulatus]
MDPPNAAQLANVAHDLMVSKMYSLASCVMLFYDIVITMGDEVEKIWLQPRYTHITLLFALNRYLSPLGYIVIIASFHMNWPVSTCERYVLYPEALKVVTTFVIGLIFVLRVYAIYGKSKLVGCVGGALLAAELGVKIWAFLDGGRLHLPEGLHGCILVGKHPTRLAFTWIAELVFDTIIFSMTLYRTVAYYRGQHDRPQSLLKLIMRDGVTYFAVIFIVNAITVSVFIWAPSNIKAINASFSTLYAFHFRLRLRSIIYSLKPHPLTRITSLMVSRLILNLKTAAQATNIYAVAVGQTNFSSVQYGENTIHSTIAHTGSRNEDVKMQSLNLTPSSKLFVTRQEIGRISNMGKRSMGPFSSR